MIGDSQAPAHVDPVAQTILNYKQESDVAKRNRMIQNRENFECYHLRQDYSHKKRGQSQEFLAKQNLAVEQITSFLQQGLMDEGDWFRIDLEPGVDKNKQKIQAKEMEKLVLNQLSKNKFPYFMADSLKLGLLGSLMIAKVGGKKVKNCTYEAREQGYEPLEGKKTKLIRKEKEIWQLDLSLVRQEDYFPDPTGDGLYEVQRIEMDYHKLIEIAKANPDEFDMDAVKMASPYVDDLQKTKKSRETDQNATISNFRKRVMIYECWGTLIHPHTGEIIKENCLSRIDGTGQVLTKPMNNPNWHDASPFVVSPITRVPHSVWHKAMMDAATKLNIAINELYNLMLDAGLMSVFGVRQVRVPWLSDPSQITDGVMPGETLKVNSSCPPGMKVLERIDTAALSADALQMYNLTDREFQQSAMTNDTRLGTLPQRAVKATEIVASNQSITGVFNGIVKTVEEEYVARLLDKCWLTMAQYMDDLDNEETKALLGSDRASVMSLMTPEERYAATAQGHVFKVFGLSATVNKIQDFKKIQALLQSIAAPEMMAEFKRKYSFTKLLGEIVKSLDIDEDKIEMTPEEQKEYQAEQQKAEQMQMLEMQMGQAKKGGPPNAQSQIPQMASASNEGGVTVPRGAMGGVTTPQ